MKRHYKFIPSRAMLCHESRDFGGTVSDGYNNSIVDGRKVEINCTPVSYHYPEPVEATVREVYTTSKVESLPTIKQRVEYNFKHLIPTLMFDLPLSSGEDYYMRVHNYNAHGVVVTISNVNYKVSKFTDRVGLLRVGYKRTKSKGFLTVLAGME